MKKTLVAAAASLLMAVTMMAVSSPASAVGGYHTIDTTCAAGVPGDRTTGTYSINTNGNGTAFARVRYYLYRNGKLARQRSAQANPRAVVSFGTLPKGTYRLTASGITPKNSVFKNCVARSGQFRIR